MLKAFAYERADFSLARVPTFDDRVNDAHASFFARGDVAPQADHTLGEFMPFLRADIGDRGCSTPSPDVIGAAALRLVNGEEMIRSDNELDLYTSTRRYLTWMGFFRSYLFAHLVAYGGVSEQQANWLRSASAWTFRVIRSALMLWRAGLKPPATETMIIDFTEAISLLRFRHEHLAAFTAAESFVGQRYERPETQEIRQLREISERPWRREE